MAELRLRRANNSLVILPDTGRTYTQGWLDFELTERTINRTLVSDLIATKRVFSITWEQASRALVSQLVLLFLDERYLTFEEEQHDGSFLSWDVRLTIGANILRDIEAQDYSFVGFVINLEQV